MKPTGDLSSQGIFYAVQMAATGGGKLVIGYTLGTGIEPTGMLSIMDTLQTMTKTFRVSDVDYVAEGGQTGSVAYPALVSEAIDVNRTLALSPAQGNAQITWGSLVLSNATDAWSGPFQTLNVSLQPISILAGMKARDDTRQIDIDPPATDLVPAFVGVGGDWTLSDGQLTVDLDDVSRYLARYVASQVAYDGTGGLNGAASLAGRYSPMVRGGTAAAPVRFVTPIEIDAINWIYQYNNAAGTVVQVYVSGNAGAFPLATSVGTNGDVPDLYASSLSIPQGYYVTCNAKGLLRFGSLPSGTVTLDVTGAFPSGAAPTTAWPITLAVLQEELKVPAAMIDVAYFGAIPAIYQTGDIDPPIGWYWNDGNLLTGSDMLAALLAGLNLRLITTRAGLLRLAPLRSTTFLFPAKGALSEDQISTIDTVALPDDVTTPVWRWQVGFQHCFTTMSATDLSAQATADLRAFVQTADRFYVWTNPATALAYANPGNPATLTTAILTAAAAGVVATSHGSMWGQRRRSFLLTIPRKLALAYDITDMIQLSWADAGISGQNAIVVGEQFRSDEATTRLQVLL